VNSELLFTSVISVFELALQTKSSSNSNALVYIVFDPIKAEL